MSAWPQRALPRLQLACGPDSLVCMQFGILGPLEVRDGVRLLSLAVDDGRAPSWEPGLALALDARLKDAVTGLQAH